MSDFGRYSLSYEPSDESWGYHVDAEIQMSISAEADLERMCDFFESFLRASGYIFDGRVEIVASDETLDNNFWKGKYLELMQVVE